ncbi:hypothetical protein [Streptomyces synnematoformans]|uniref:Uncharacterized protein n=1 Tax=Streptomyces synnematoformans TaxID=415721 RepID=A0ABN2YJB0_9ACTN
MTNKKHPARAGLRRLQLINLAIGPHRPVEAFEWLARQVPDVLFCQQIPPEAINDLADVLGMTGYPAATAEMAPKPRTAVYVRTVEQGGRLVVESSAEDCGSLYHPRSGIAVRLVVEGRPSRRWWRLASEQSCPDNSTIRLEEADWWVRWLTGEHGKDDGDREDGGQRLCTVGGSWHSFPVGDTPTTISRTVLPARRSYLGSDGKRRPDDRPDDALHQAGYCDAARWARRRFRQPRAVDFTERLGPGGGGSGRTHRIYLSEELVPAISSVRVGSIADVGGTPLPVRAEFWTQHLYSIMNRRTA